MVSNAIMVSKEITLWNIQQPTMRTSKSRDGKPPTQTWSSFKTFFPQEIGYHHRQKRIHIRSKKHLRCTDTPSRRALGGDRQLEHYYPGNSDA